MQEEVEAHEFRRGQLKAHQQMKKGLKCADPQGLADHHKRMACERRRKKTIKSLQKSLKTMFEANDGCSPTDPEERTAWTKRWAKLFTEKVDKDAPCHTCISCCQLFFSHQTVNFTPVALGKLETQLKKAAKTVEDALSNVAPQNEAATRKRIAPLEHFPAAFEDIRAKYEEAKRNAETHPKQFGSPDRPSVVCCNRCWGALRRGMAPNLGQWNKLRPEDVPPFLSKTNDLERQLLARSIVFQKLISLPRGSQKAVKGLMANVPSSMSHTMDRLNLPQSLTSAQVVAVELKRSLSHKSQYRSMVIRIARLFGALQELRAQNPFYSDIEIADADAWAKAATEELPEETRHLVRSEQETVAGMEKQADEEDLLELGSDDEEDENELDDDAVALQQAPVPDAAIIPAEGMDLQIDGVQQRRQQKKAPKAAVTVAPGQGQKPVSVLLDKHVEEKAYPGLYPKAENTYAAERSLRVTLGEWVKNRLTHSDTRYIRDAGYAFFLYQRLQYERLASSVSVCLNKRKMVSQFGQRLTDVDPTSDEFYQSFVAKDSGYRFLRAIRGTPSYWKSQMLDLIAMVKQLGPPTFFITLSGKSLQRVLLSLSHPSRLGCHRNASLPITGKLVLAHFSG